MVATGVELRPSRVSGWRKRYRTISHQPRILWQLPRLHREISPDHVGEEVSASDNTAENGSATVLASSVPSRSEGLVPTSYPAAATAETQSVAVAGRSNTKVMNPSKAAGLPLGGTVVLDMDDAKIVPSFLGKPVRAVIEESENAGLEVDIFGSGVARQQNPPPGARLPSGGHVTVQFAR